VKKSSRVLGALGAASALLLALTACGSVGEGSASGGAAGGGSDDGVFRIATVSKVEGISWFQRMSEGVQQFNDDNSDQVKAWQTGPSEGDPAQQVQVVEDLIAQGVDAIVVIPNDPQSIAPVLKKARDAGIVVITHEAPALVGTDSIDYDLEAFDNADFGRQMFEPMAKAMGGKGQFVGMVGSLTSETHMAWYNAGVEYLKQNYPDIQVVAAQPYEDNNDDAEARDNALEILRAYPDLKGYVGTSVSAEANMAAVLKEKNNHNVAVSGLSLPSIAGPYIEDGWMTYAQAWDPAGAGYVGSQIALDVLQKKAVATGDDLGYDGYDSVTVDGKLISGEATLPIEKGDFTDGSYPF
jgi:simple sugar transport system substrate-binding protein